MVNQHMHSTSPDELSRRLGNILRADDVTPTETSVRHQQMLDPLSDFGLSMTIPEYVRSFSCDGLMAHELTATEFP